jgi:hypothetical protein
MAPALQKIKRKFAITVEIFVILDNTIQLRGGNTSVES